MAATAAAGREWVRRVELQNPRRAMEVAAQSDAVVPASVTQDLIARYIHCGDTSARSSGALTQCETEECRIRAELASVRSGVHNSDIPPSGRHFDPAPDTTDEIAYDALEKAYNLAFGVSEPERLKRSDANDEWEGEGHMDPFVSTDLPEDMAEQIRQSTARKQYALEQEELSCTAASSSQWKREDDAMRVRSLDKLRKSRKFDATHNESTQRNSSRTADSQVVLSGAQSVLDRAKLFASTRTRRVKLLLHLAEACRSRVLSRSRTRHHVENGYNRSSTIPLALQILTQPTENQPARLQASPNDETSDSMPSECREVAEFLVTQLTLYADSLTQGQQRPVKNRVAVLASRQLLLDQQRAFADSETNSLRLNDYQLQIDDSTRANVANHSHNPFQRAGETFESAWKSSLKRVEYGDWQHGARGESCSSPLRESIVNRKLMNLYTRGLNAILVHRGEGAHNEIASFILQIQNLRTPGYVHLVVTDACRIEEWGYALSKQGILVLPLWGSKSARDRLHTVANEKWTPLVFLCGSETIAQDIEVLAVVPLQLCILDVNSNASGYHGGPLPSVWTYVMSLKCRQRVLVSQPAPSLDARVIALFAYPGAVCSRRKILAWNCAALSRRHVSSIIDAVGSCAIPIDSDERTLTEWSGSVEKTTLKSAQREKRTLDALTRDVAAYSSADERSSYAMSLFHPEIEMPSVSAKKHTRTIRRDPPSISVPDTKIPRLHIKKVQNVPTKRRRRSSKSRKRISRCGKCAGCLAEDCMKCGHCQDMKKYGGPGLRKQSCKRRKCLNPKTWGLKRKRGSREEDSSFRGDRESNDAESSDVESSDLDSLQDADSGFHSASESDDSGGGSSIAKDDPSIPGYESDSYASSHLGDEVVESSHGDIGNVDDTDNDEPSSDATRYSRAGRSRVMRCGKCRGCTSGDCMKCIHCQDMKKYGGPGLRKQSCKNRKCIAPKVVLLNQMREKIDTVGEEGPDGEHLQTEDSLIESQVDVEVDVTDLLQSRGRLAQLHVIQECALVIRKYQFFSCDSCLRAFTSQKLLEQHLDVFHGNYAGPTAWERSAEEFVLHPANQLACLIASRRSINPGWQAPAVRAYAKLEGAGFEYFMLKPFAVLGRVSQCWGQFYKTRGYVSTRGLAGGTVDCHIGDDGMVAREHALIRWDKAFGQFTIECLSFRSPLSVNGHEVHYASRPLRLRSQDLIQIGATTAYFLLPTTDTESGSNDASEIPRHDVRAWLDATLTARRARTAHDEAISHKIRQDF